MSTNDPSQQPNVFDAAKRIADILAGMQKPDQERVLRWVGENLGIQLAAASAVAGPGQPPAAADIRPTPGLTPGQATGTGRPTDIQSFVQGKQPKTDQQYAAVVAYYYRFEAPEGQRRDTLDTETLRESTRQSGWKRLTAPAMTLTRATDQGYLDRVDRGVYRINTVGENLVAMTLPSASDNAGRVRSGRKKSTKKAVRPSTRRTRKSRGK